VLPAVPSMASRGRCTVAAGTHILIYSCDQTCGERFDRLEGLTVEGLAESIRVISVTCGIAIRQRNLIVAQIETEQKIVYENRRLILIYVVPTPSKQPLRLQSPFSVVATLRSTLRSTRLRRMKLELRRMSCTGGAFSALWRRVKDNFG
jgi:hypothetical protein